MLLSHSLYFLSKILNFRWYLLLCYPPPSPSPILSVFLSKILNLGWCLLMCYPSPDPTHPPYLTQLSFLEPTPSPIGGWYDIWMVPLIVGAIISEWYIVWPSVPCIAGPPPTNRLPCDSGMLWPLVTSKCGRLWRRNSVYLQGDGY